MRQKRKRKEGHRLCGTEKEIGRDVGARFRDWRQRGTETMRHKERNREGQGNEIERKRHRGTDAMRHRER